VPLDETVLNDAVLRFQDAMERLSELAYNDDFDESKHKRDHGKFARTAGGAAEGAEHHAAQAREFREKGNSDVARPHERAAKHYTEAHKHYSEGREEEGHASHKEASGHGRTGDNRAAKAGGDKPEEKKTETKKEEPAAEGKEEPAETKKEEPTEEKEAGKPPRKIPNLRYRAFSHLTTEQLSDTSDGPADEHTQKRINDELEARKADPKDHDDYNKLIDDKAKVKEAKLPSKLRDKIVAYGGILQNAEKIGMPLPTAIKEAPRLEPSDKVKLLKALGEDSKESDFNPVPALPKIQAPKTKSPKLSDAEHDAVRDYTSDARYSNMNVISRGGGDVLKKNGMPEEEYNDLERATTNLTAAIGKSSFQGDATLRRGVSPHGTMSKLKVGDTYAPGKFTSASSKDSSAEQFGSHMVTILAPAGSKALRVTGSSGEAGASEAEYIFHPHSKFTVEKVEPGHTTIRLVSSGEGDSGERKDAAPRESLVRAAGIMFLTDDSQVLLLKRGNGSDHPGEWCFPGGHQEEGESTEEAAEREAIEELGFLPPGPRAVLTRSIADGVDYTTFLQRVKSKFIPEVNGEHTGFMWVALDQLGTAADPPEDTEVRADPPINDEEDFDESKHPRAADGRFGSKGGPGGGSPVKARKGPMISARYENKAFVHHESGERLPEHVQKLKIPPAWRDVRVSQDPSADLLATGKDAKGRPVAVYSKAFEATKAAEKFGRVHELIEKFDGIRKQNAAVQKSDDPRKRDAADCLDLIMQMGIRPGSETDTGAKVQAYGATTLQGRHVVVAGKKVSLQFVGKKGVSLNLPVPDGPLAAMLVKRMGAAGPDGKLFPNTNDKHLLEHTHTMDGGGFKTKDFRTRLGTATAYEMVRSGAPPISEEDYRKRVMEVARVVSEKLGNTPVIALQSYISPTVFHEWRQHLDDHARADADFDESKHPRAEDGRFGSGGGGARGAVRSASKKVASKVKGAARSFGHEDHEVIAHHFSVVRPEDRSRIAHGIHSAARMLPALLKTHLKEEKHNAVHAAGALRAITTGKRPTPEQMKGLKAFGLRVGMIGGSLAMGDPSGLIHHGVSAALSHIGMDAVMHIAGEHALAAMTGLGKAIGMRGMAGATADAADDMSDEDTELLQKFIEELAKALENLTEEDAHRTLEESSEDEDEDEESRDDADFDESKHPRASDGKFGKGSAGAAAGAAFHKEQAKTNEGLRNGALHRPHNRAAKRYAEAFKHYEAGNAEEGNRLHEEAERHGQEGIKRVLNYHKALGKAGGKPPEPSKPEAKVEPAKPAPPRTDPEPPAPPAKAKPPGPRSGGGKPAPPPPRMSQEDFQNHIRQKTTNEVARLPHLTQEFRRGESFHSQSWHGAPDDIHHAVASMKPVPTTRTTKGAHYQRRYPGADPSVINMPSTYDLDRYLKAAVWRHEAGHAMDHQRGVQFGHGETAYASSRTSIATVDDAAALTKASSGHVNLNQKDGFHRFVSSVDEGKGERYPDNFLVPEAAHSDTELMLADFVGAMTRNRIGWGHPDDYYTADPTRQQAEMFANYVSLSSHPDHGERLRGLCRKLAPRSCAKFDKIIAGEEP
jgi:DNA topoisomerase-1